MPLMPNAGTVKTMKAAHRDELVKVGSIGNLLAELRQNNLFLFA